MEKGMLKGMCKECSKKATVSMSKAKEIMKHEEAHDKPLTKKQIGFFGAIAGGSKPTKKTTKRK